MLHTLKNTIKQKVKDKDYDSFSSTINEVIDNYENYNYFTWEVAKEKGEDFLFFIIGRFSNVVGVQILTVAVGWHVYQLTGDPLDLGYIGLAQFLPALFLFLIAGYVCDKYDRRIILFLCNIAHFIVVVMLMLALWGEYNDVRIIFGVLVLHDRTQCLKNAL